MAEPSSRSPRTRSPRALSAEGNELFELVVDYAKQETIGPVKSLGRFVAFGVTGSILLSVGVAVLLLAMLRALQTETNGTFSGNLSWVPYLITAAVAVLLAVLAAWRVVRGEARRSLPDRNQAGG